MQMKYKAAVFDMDGTILDTIADLAFSINTALALYGYRHDFSSETACLFVGSGARVAIRRALALVLGASPDSLEWIGTPQEKLPQAYFALPSGEEERLEEAFRRNYPKKEGGQTQPYPGIKELLQVLHSHGIKTAVVSNKPDKAVLALAEKIFPGLFDEAIGEQEKEGIRRKPSPDMVLLALKRMEIPVSEAVYIGDSEIDLQTAAAAGMDCISVGWGYRSAEFLNSHGAVRIVKDTQELLEAFQTS